MKIHYTSGYHLEAGRQTIHLNQTLEQYLCVYCSYQQDNWSELLPLGEFTYNNTPAASTGVSPFFANKNYHPNIMVYPERKPTSQKARDFVVYLDELHMVLCQQLAEAQEHYQGPADCRHSPAPDFQVGQQVFVRAEFICMTRPSKKLAEKYLRPFNIIACPGTHSFTLRLPERLCSIHPVFYVSQLELAVLNKIPNRTQSPPPLVEVKGELEYKISEILVTCHGARAHPRTRCGLPHLLSRKTRSSYHLENLTYETHYGNSDLHYRKFTKTKSLQTKTKQEQKTKIKQK
jgi:hypothetical protein